jgi:hypothetical protein
MVVLLMGAIGLARRQRAKIAGLTWALSSFVKWTALLTVPLQVLEDRAHGRRSMLPVLVVSGLVLAALATVRYGIDWIAHPLSVSGDAASALSLSIWPRLPAFIPSEVGLLAPIAAFVLAYLWLMRTAWRGRARNGLASILFLIASPYLWTWYLITPAALSSIDDDGTAMSLTLMMVAYAGLLYLGDAGSVFRLFV